MNNLHISIAHREVNEETKDNNRITRLKLSNMNELLIIDCISKLFGTDPKVNKDNCKFFFSIIDYTNNDPYLNILYDIIIMMKLNIYMQYQLRIILLIMLRMVTSIQLRKQ
jgi:hypothetical protein